MLVDADAIVIGAGAAGLAAARSLAERSLRVMLLEARERTGGRVAQAPAARAAVAAELGAEFIHGPAAETMALLREAANAALDTSGESWIRGAGGELLRDDDDFRAAGGIFDRAGTLEIDESVERFLQRFADDPALRKAVADARAFVEGFEAADPAIASVRSIAAELQSGVDSTSRRPLGGYRPMFDRLSDACARAGVRTELSTTVRRISWHRGAVTVDADCAGTPRTLRARTAIVTLPAGVLRQSGEIAFDPELPAAKRAALGRIEMGHVVKAIVRFRTAFWEKIRNGRYRDAGFFHCTGGPFAGYWTQFPVRSTSIVAWAGGPAAIALRECSDEERIARALEGFGALLGEPELARREFETGFTHDWSRDPFARGAYSYVAVDGGNARALLAAPVDETLFFAGEATSNDGQGGTVNGALETGERAAREAAAALGVTA
jgi:monoamine oxidase